MKSYGCLDVTVSEVVRGILNVKERPSNGLFNTEHLCFKILCFFYDDELFTLCFLANIFTLFW